MIYSAISCYSCYIASFEQKFIGGIFQDMDLKKHCCWLCSWQAVAIHGDKSQQERDWVLNGS
jgi:hypothetical protein